MSAANNSTGVLELDPQPDMLLPFEGSGVDMSWEFNMPKASNQLDYRAIADVLVTLEYTALNSIDYRQQVIQSCQYTSRQRRKLDRHDHQPPHRRVGIVVAEYRGDQKPLRR
jgi:hypothetical protein